MVGHLATIEFHPCLHGGLPKCRTGTTTIEAKLAQKLAWMEQEPLYQVYLVLRKAYDHLDQERCLAIMTGPQTPVPPDNILGSGTYGLLHWG